MGNSIDAAMQKGIEMRGTRRDDHHAVQTPTKKTQNIYNELPPNMCRHNNSLRLVALFPRYRITSHKYGCFYE